MNIKPKHNFLWTLKCHLWRLSKDHWDCIKAFILPLLWKFRQKLLFAVARGEQCKYGLKITITSKNGQLQTWNKPTSLHLQLVKPTICARTNSRRKKKVAILKYHFKISDDWYIDNTFLESYPYWIYSNYLEIGQCFMWGTLSHYSITFPLLLPWTWINTIPGKLQVHVIHASWCYYRKPIP